MVGRRVPSGRFISPDQSMLSHPTCLAACLADLVDTAYFFSLFNFAFSVMYSRPERRLSWIFGLFNKVISTSNRIAGLLFFIYLTMISQLHNL